MEKLNQINMGFLLVNCASIIIVSRYHQLSVTFEIEGKNTVEGFKKKGSSVKSD